MSPRSSHLELRQEKAIGLDTGQEHSKNSHRHGEIGTGFEATVISSREKQTEVISFTDGPKTVVEESGLQEREDQAVMHPAQGLQVGQLLNLIPRKLPTSILSPLHCPVGFNFPHPCRAFSSSIDGPNHSATRIAFQSLACAHVSPNPRCC